MKLYLLSFAIPTTCWNICWPKNLKRLPIGSWPGQKLLRHRLVDHDDVRRVRLVGFAQRTPAQQRDAERLQVVRADDVDLHQASGPRVRRVLPFEEHRPAEPAAEQRHAAGQRRVLDAGNRRGALERRSSGTAGRAPRCSSGRRDRTRGSRHPRRRTRDSICCAFCRLRRNSPAPISATSDSAICAGDQEVADAEAPDSAGRLAALLLQLRHQIRTRGLERRREPEHDAGDERHRDRERSTREPGVHVETESSGRNGGRKDQRAARPSSRSAGPGGATGQREHESFGEQLPHRAGGVPRQATGGWRSRAGGRRRGRAGGSPRWRRQSTARARRSSSAARRPRPGCREARVDRRLRQRQERHVPPLIVVRVLGRELTGDRLEVRVGLLQRRAGSSAGP